MRKKGQRMKEILLANRKLKGNANPQMAHLVFANTQANPKKTKRVIFLTNARAE